MNIKSMILSVAVAATLAAPAIASVFTAGTVTNVAASDVLKARRWPAASSRVIDTYLNGDSVSLTGRCKNTITNVSFRIDMGGTRAAKYNKMARANTWCQIVTPDGEVGWVRGRFVMPQ